jgi:hypothetical protein
MLATEAETRQSTPLINPKAEYNPVEATMTNPLDPVRAAFDKALGPFLKRQKIIAELKESDIGKERRAQLVKESKQLDDEWVAALVELRRVIDQCPLFQGKV